MILVIGQLPTAENSRDGMVQRIAALDRELERHERVYLMPHQEPFRRPAFELRSVGPGLRVGRPNTFDREHLRRVAQLGREAQAVLVHSVHWAQHVLPLYPLGHVITDLHGVVPEEQALLGDSAASAHLGRVEAYVLRHSAKLLVVSEAMADHFRAKYPKLRPAFLTLPVLSAGPGGPPPKPAPPPWRLLYAGGNQPWQNLDRMLQALRATPVPYQMSLLTPEVEAIFPRVAAAGLSSRVHVRSVAPEAMAAEYAQAHLGFVLRDDSVVNRAACPTKLQEYLAHGLVPVVSSRAMGDFERLGYRTVSLENFKAGELPSQAELAAATDQNLEVFHKLEAVAEQGRTALRASVESLEQRALADGEDVAELAAEVLLQRWETTRRHLSRYPLDHLLRLARKLRL